jgi:CDP-glycerol glycerophosphotransferase (TagB/SpsB family)
VPEGVALVVKPHPMDRDDYAGLGGRVVSDEDLGAADVTLAQLLAAADALVSDASSAWVDYLVHDRPVGFFLPDLDTFGEARGYNVPDVRAVLPGPVLPDPAAVSGFLADVRDGTARPPSAFTDAMQRIGFSARLPVTDALLDWLDDYQVARGARPLFGSPAARGAHDGG